MGNYFQKEIECASADQIRAWQSERLVKQVKNKIFNLLIQIISTLFQKIDKRY